MWINISSFFSLIRSKNLLIVAVTQSLIYYKLILGINAQIAPDLGISLCGLVIFSTICIAASGYIINDILDVDIDKINKAETRIVDRVLSLKSAWWLYWVVVIIGFLDSLYVAYQIDNLPLVLIYPAAVSLLYLYSKYFKKKGLIGNLVVAIFCAFVTGIIMFAERNFLSQLMAQGHEGIKFIIDIFIAYMIFGFLMTLYREIIKDIEDLEGDKAQNYDTLAVTLGIGRAKMTALIIGVFTLCCTVAWGYYLQTNNALGDLRSSSFLVLFLIVPMGYTLWLNSKALAKADFHQISTMIKLIMAAGIIYLLIL